MKARSLAVASPPQRRPPSGFKLRARTQIRQLDSAAIPSASLRQDMRKDARTLDTGLLPVDRHRGDARTRRNTRGEAAIASLLPEPTWRAVHHLFVKAKSLGDIAQVTVAFFKEHEQHRGETFPSAQPAVIPAAEISAMLKEGVPRKRRIYDVLHVLEGVGMLKRARCDNSGKRERIFMFYGSDAAIRHLALLKSESTWVVQSLRRTTVPRPTQEEEDRTLIEMYVDRGKREKWASLTTVTMCLLGLLLQEGSRTAVSLPLIIRRLARAKQVASTPNDDANRRVYDIVSILASCGLVVTSGATKPVDVANRVRTDTSRHRKHVRFNFDVFACTESTGDQLTTETPSCVSDRSTQQHLVAGGRPVAFSALATEVSAGNRQPTTANGWWDDSLKSLSFVDALLAEERVGLEVQERFKQDWNEPWNSSSMSQQIHQDFLLSDMGLPVATTTADIDFECHESLSNKAASEVAEAELGDSLASEI